jgi:ATP-binding cassette subfamily B protein
LIFLDEEEQPDESNKTLKLDKIDGNIAFEHVKFGYTKDRVIVHDFSEVGKPGQKIAIVGPTGAGKTTMVNLLMRFYELNSGRITIEGVDTKEMNRSYVRSLFGMVLQDTWLFEGTIMENLKYSRPEATDEEVYEACRATHCDSFIRQQPNGYDHILNEDCGLSAGQKQLLTIARAMIQNAPMLILDEATSSVDTRTELQIQDAMDKLMKGRTSFVIAHRLSTIKNSDLIIVMKDGDVLETGNHDQLMALDGFYAALYNSQFTGKGPQFS